jgi:hypothetical protein
VPLGNKTQVMSDTQVTAAAGTFAKRYAFCNVFGIMTGDEDTDGADPQPPANYQPRATYQPPVRPAPAKPAAPIKTPQGNANPALANFIQNQNQPAPAQPAAPAKPWEKWSKPKDKEPEHFFCQTCGKTISGAENGYSNRVFKKPLCRDCQGAERNH